MRGQTRALTLVGSKGKANRAHYPIEFKLQLLAEAEKDGVQSVAKLYGIHSSVLYYWRNGGTHGGRHVNQLSVTESLTSSKSAFRATTSMVKVKRIPPLAQAKVDLAEANGELTALRERCRQLEWLVGKMVSTHPDLAKFLTGKGPR